MIIQEYDCDKASDAGAALCVINNTSFNNGEMARKWGPFAPGMAQFY